MTDRIPDDVVAGKPFSFWELTIKDTFDLKELYKRIRLFHIEEGFKDLFANKDDFESFYYEKENPDGTKAHKIWWRAQKICKKRRTQSPQILRSTSTIQTVMMTKKEIMINGQKVKLDSGELKLEFSLYIDFHANKDDFDKFKNHFNSQILQKPSR